MIDRVVAMSGLLLELLIALNGSVAALQLLLPFDTFMLKQRVTLSRQVRVHVPCGEISVSLCSRCWLLVVPYCISN